MPNKGFKDFKKKFGVVRTDKHRVGKGVSFLKQKNSDMFCDSSITSGAIELWKVNVWTGMGEGFRTYLLIQFLSSKIPFLVEAFYQVGLKKPTTSTRYLLQHEKELLDNVFKLAIIDGMKDFLFADVNPTEYYKDWYRPIPDRSECKFPILNQACRDLNFFRPSPFVKDGLVLNKDPLQDGRWYAQSKQNCGSQPCTLLPVLIANKNNKIPEENKFKGVYVANWDLDRRIGPSDFVFIKNYVSNPVLLVSTSGVGPKAAKIKSKDKPRASKKRKTTVGGEVKTAENPDDNSPSTTTSHPTSESKGQGVLEDQPTLLRIHKLSCGTVASWKRGFRFMVVNIENLKAMRSACIVKMECCHGVEDAVGSGVSVENRDSAPREDLSVE